jgi:hypothetical protein
MTVYTILEVLERLSPEAREIFAKERAAAVPFAEKGDYWSARDAAGWPFRRRKAKATT